MSNTPDHAQIYSSIVGAKTVALRALADHCRSHPTLFTQEDRQALFLSTVMSMTATTVYFDPELYPALLLIYLRRDVPASVDAQSEIDEFSSLFASL